MAEVVRAGAGRVIAAPPAQVRDLLLDYREGRPRILTGNYQEYAVEEGGRGAGTLVRYRFKAGPRERWYRMRVETAGDDSITERDLESSLTTVWTLRPAAGGGSTDVRIETSWQGAGGVGGFFERTFAPRALSGVYREMLDRLEAALGG
jgi:hypothetical protein